MIGASATLPRHGLGSVAEVARLIEAGHMLILAGAEEILAELPPGNWIGGTTAHFLTPQGGIPAARHIFFTDLTPIALKGECYLADEHEVRDIGRRAPRHGFTLLIIPGYSPLLMRLARDMLDYEGVYNIPLTGWVAAVDLEQIGQRQPKCFAGGPQGRHDRAAIMYITLPEDFFAQLHIVNLFTPGTGPVIRFPAETFIQREDCLIDSQPANLARYIAKAQIDPRLPLVADHDGALLSVSLLPDMSANTVHFLSPVCANMEYRFAETVLDYEVELHRAIAALGEAQSMIASVCVLHYRHASLPAWRGLPFMGPVTFGQIAYTILNQTFTCLSISRLDDAPEDPPPH